MAQKRETRRQRKIKKGLKKAFPGSWWVKIHGGWFQEAGIPDLIGCVEGLFFAFEVKEPDGDTSEIQDITIEDIQLAGGCAHPVIELEEAIDHVRKAIRQANRSGKLRTPQ